MIESFCFDQIYINILRRMLYNKFYSILTKEEAEILDNHQRYEIKKKQESQKIQQTNLFSFFPTANVPFQGHSRSLFLQNQSNDQFIFNSGKSFSLLRSENDKLLSSKELNILFDFLWMVSFFLNYLHTQETCNKNNLLSNAIEHFKVKLFSQIQFVLVDFFIRFSDSNMHKFDTIILNLLNSNILIPKLILHQIGSEFLFSHFDKQMKIKKCLYIFSKIKYEELLDTNYFMIIESKNSKNIFLILLNFFERIVNKCNIDTTSEMLIFLSNFVFSIFSHLNTDIMQNYYLIGFKNVSFETHKQIVDQLQCHVDNLNKLKVDIFGKCVEFIFQAFKKENTFINFDKLLSHKNQRNGLLINTNQSSLSLQRSSNGIIFSNSKKKENKSIPKTFDSKNQKLLFEVEMFCKSILQFPLAFSMFFSQNVEFTQSLPIENFQYQDWMNQYSPVISSEVIEKLSFILQISHKLIE